MTARVYVDSERLILVTVASTGEATIARRDRTSGTWSPPEPMRDETRHDDQSTATLVMSALCPTDYGWCAEHGSTHEGPRIFGMTANDDGLVWRVCHANQPNAWLAYPGWLCVVTNALHDPEPFYRWSWHRDVESAVEHARTTTRTPREDDHA